MYRKKMYEDYTRALKDLLIDYSEQMPDDMQRLIQSELAELHFLQNNQGYPPKFDMDKAVVR